jgi:hypothetical protein
LWNEKDSRWKNWDAAISGQGLQKVSQQFSADAERDLSSRSRDALSGQSFQQRKQPAEIIKSAAEKSRGRRHLFSQVCSDMPGGRVMVNRERQKTVIATLSIGVSAAVILLQDSGITF